MDNVVLSIELDSRVVEALREVKTPVLVLENLGSAEGTERNTEVENILSHLLTQIKASV